MCDPLSKIPEYMRDPLDANEGRLYDILRAEYEKEGSVEAMLEFLKRQGAFFYSLDEILSSEFVAKFDLADVSKREDGSNRTDWAEAFVRTQPPDFEVQGGQSENRRVKEFKVTEGCMESGEPVASVNSEGQSSTAKKVIWDVDIFGRPYERVKSSEVAHLLPAAPNHAIEWYDVACWAMGRNPVSVQWEEVFRLLHGTKSGNPMKRIHGSGIRHFVVNKARINEQVRLIDKTDPQLLVLPIQSRQQCLLWNGEDYDAVVLLGTDRNKRGYIWALDAVGMNKKTMKASRASKQELESALMLMRQMTYALVQSLVHLKPPQVPDGTDEQARKEMEEAIEKRNDRLKSFNTIMGTETIQVPKQGCFPIDEDPFRGVCRISFSRDKEKGLHPPPDPLLLVARAAVVFSVRQNFRLRASAVAEDDYDCEEDAMQFENLERVARLQGLGQVPDGVQVAVAEGSESGDDVSAVSLESSLTHNSGGPSFQKYCKNSPTDIALTHLGPQVEEVT